MFLGLFGSQVGVKVPEAAAQRVRAAGGGPFGPVDRPMGGYVALPDGWQDRAETARAWVTAALEHVAALPPKAAKKTARTTATRDRGRAPRTRSGVRPTGR